MIRDSLEIEIEFIICSFDRLSCGFNKQLEFQKKNTVCDFLELVWVKILVLEALLAFFEATEVEEAWNEVEKQNLELELQLDFSELVWEEILVLEALLAFFEAAENKFEESFLCL